MKFSTDTHSAQKMNPDDFGDSLAFLKNFTNPVKYLISTTWIGNKLCTDIQGSEWINCTLWNLNSCLPQDELK